MVLKSSFNTTNIYKDYPAKGLSNNTGSSVLSKPNSAVNPTDKLVGTVGDKFTKADKTKSQKPIEPVSVIFNRIKQKCDENDIDINELQRGIENITGLVTEEDKNKLTEKQQAVLFSIVEKILDRSIKLKKVHKNNDIDLLKSVLNQAAFASEVIIKQKSYQDYNSLDNDVNSLGNEFLNAIENLTLDELDSRISKLKKDTKKEIEEFNKSIAGYSEKEQKEMKKAKLEQMNATLSLMYLRLCERASKEVSLNALTMLSPNDAEKCHEALYDMQASDELRKELAKADDYNIDKRLLKSYEAEGIKFDEEAYQKMVARKTSWKDKTSLTEYYAQFNSALENREENTYLTEEVVNTTYKGIGVGAQINHVMTEDEKSEFVETWNSDVKAYYGEDSKQYKELKSHVEQKVEEYNKGEVQKQEANLSASEVKTELSVKQHYQSLSRTQVPIMPSPASLSNFTKTFGNNHFDLNNKFVVTNPENVDISDIRRRISEGELRTDKDIQEAIGANSNHEVVTFLAKDPVLRVTPKARIRNYISNENPANGNLQTLAEKVPVIIPDIMNYMRGDKQKFAEQLISQRKVSYDRAKGIEKELEDENGQKISV